MDKIEKAKKEKILVVVLALVFLFMLAWRFIQPGEESSLRLESLVSDKAPEAAVESAKERSLQDVRILEYSGDKQRDPFEVSLELLSELSKISTAAGGRNVSPGGETAVSQTAPAVDLSLQGIVWGKEKLQAIINGEVLEKGDEISGMKIIDIQKEKVRLLYQGEEVDITFQKGE